MFIRHSVARVMHVLCTGAMYHGEKKMNKMKKKKQKTKLKLILNMYLTFVDGSIQSIDPNLHFCHHLFSLHCQFEFYFFLSVSHA